MKSKHVVFMFAGVALCWFMYRIFLIIGIAVMTVTAIRMLFGYSSGQSKLQKTWTLLMSLFWWPPYLLEDVEDLAAFADRATSK